MTTPNEIETLKARIEARSLLKRASQLRERARGTRFEARVRARIAEARATCVAYYGHDNPWVG